MKNAKQELLDILVDTAKIKCAFIEYETIFNDSSKYILKLNYSEKEYNDFLNSLNFNYYNGYGGQELFGTVWLEDGTWFERGEYDGSEWWEHNKLPEIPNECI